MRSAQQDIHGIPIGRAIKQAEQMQQGKLRPATCLALSSSFVQIVPDSRASPFAPAWRGSAFRPTLRALLLQASS